MPYIRMLAFLVLSLSMLSCGPKPPPIVEPSTIEVPDGKNTKTISLAKITSRVSKGTEVGWHREGQACVPYGKLSWQVGQASIGDAELYSVFYEELKRNNYNVVGNPNDMFESKIGEGELAVGGMITKVRWDICLHNSFFDGGSSGSSYVELDIEWQVYNVLDKKTVYRFITTGRGNATYSNRQYKNGFRDAFANAIRGLLADKGFMNAVLDKPPAGPMGGLTEAVPVPRTSGGPQVQRPAASAPVKGKALNIEDVRSRVVHLRNPSKLGSGFLVGSEGLIMTNEHVVGEHKKVRVVYADGAVTEGVVVRKDARHDLALVKVELCPLVGLPLRLDDVPPLTEVIAVGSPFGIRNSISKGIVSGYFTDPKKGRVLQSDVASNPGNSGGPLIDTQGRVVGVCMSGMGQTNTGVNFFIPIVDALRYMGISGN